MKQTVKIAVDFDRPGLLRDMVEKLVNRKDQGETGSKKDFTTASTEAYVFGTISLEEDGQKLHIPFDGSFLFTCIRIQSNEFALTWSSSLS